jgi:hypothetical protein
MPYNEFGEYIPDDLALDEMRYELAKKSIMPLRPGGSDVPYVASEVPQTYVAKPPPRPASTATNVPQAIADRLGFTALPQALLGVVSSFPAAVAKETGFPKVADAVQYLPTSRGGEDILEAASKLPEGVTGSHMGPGPLAEYFVPKRAFGLQSRSLLTPDDVRVMGGRAIESGRELRNVPEDFRTAQEGLRRESVFGGPTIGARTQGLFDEIGDVMARREMQGLSPIPGIPDIVSPDTRMYAVRRANAGQMIDPTDPPTARYADQNRSVTTVAQRLADVVPFTNFDFPHNNSHQYYNAAVRDAPSEISDAWKTFSQSKINEMFPNAPDPTSATKAYQNQFNQKNFALSEIDMLSDFSRSPEAESAVEAIAKNRDSFVAIYNELKNKPKEKKPKNDDELGAYNQRRKAHEEEVEKLELAMLKEEFMPELSSEEFKNRIRPPDKEEYMRRAQAAADYIQKEFKRDISKYIGTSQGPQMELAKRGVTITPKLELFEKMKQLQSDRGQYSGELKELEKQRARASLNLNVDEPSFNPKGEMYPLIITAENDLKSFQTKLNDLNRQKSELRDLHRIELPDVPDPARNTGPTGAKYRALKNPIDAMIDKVEQSKKHLENVMLANAYETVSDLAYTPALAKEYKRRIPFEESAVFFPNLAKTPDEAQMFNVKERELKDLGIPFLADMIVKNIMSGRIPLNEKNKPNTTIDKIVEKLTKPRIMEESMKEAEARKSMPAIDEYAQQTLFNIPPELRFKNASVLELTKDSTEDSVRRQTSFEGMVLDHCIAGCDAPHPGVNPFSGENYDHSYPVDVATGKDRGDKKLSTSFMTKVLKGDSRMGLLRDNVTGLPSVTISMNKTSDSQKDTPKYNLEFASGYRNSQIDIKYAEDVRDYLNLRSDIIKGSGDTLGKWGIVDTQSIDGQRKVASLLKIETTAGGLGLPRFVLENDIRNMALEQPMGNTHADILERRTLLKEKYTRLSRQLGENDPEVQDLASRIAGLTAELRNVSRQVATQGFSPNVFRRMTSEALTNELDDNNSRGAPFTLADDLFNRDTYGLIELWQDDMQFYPIVLRDFTEAVRNNQNLAQTQVDPTDRSGTAATTRERLARFQIAIQDFTPQQREYLVRSLDNVAELNINQMAENLNPDDINNGIEQIDHDNFGTRNYLENIARRRRGEDSEPEAAPAPQAPISVPRAIANQVVPMNQALRDQTVQEVAEAINNSIRNLPEDRETLQEALAQYQRNPLDIPGSIEMILPTSSVLGAQNENRQIISNYLIQQIQSRLGNQDNQVVPEYIRGVITRELNEMMMLGELNRAGSVLNRIFEGDGAFGTLTTDEQRTAASDFFNSTLRGLLNDPDYRPADGQRATPPDIFAGEAPRLPGNDYREMYTNELTGSRRAYDEVMQAERMTPGAINEAITRTDGDARLDEELQRFYNVDSPAGISQLNNALRVYMEGNGFDVPPLPLVNAVDELERRYGEAPRAPIDIVTDGLNRPITQFERDYSEEVQGAYRFVLREIQPYMSAANLREAMGHINIIHDMLEGNEHNPAEFNLTTRDEMNSLALLLERHFEVLRQYENLLDGMDNEPPQGRKRGGFIERATGVRSYSDLKRDKFNRNFYDDGQAALDFELRNNKGSNQLGIPFKRYPDRSEADIIAPKSDEYYDLINQNLKTGGLLRMSNGSRVNPVPTATRLPSDHPHNPPVKPVVNLTDPGFAEELKHQIEQRQKSSSRPSGGGGNLTDAELKNRLGSRNPTYNAGGKVSIDQMRYELLRK